jgi:hypothetical protein
MPRPIQGCFNLLYFVKTKPTCICANKKFKALSFTYTKVKNTCLCTLLNCEASPYFAVLSFISGRAGPCIFLCRIWKTMERELETKPHRRCGSCTKLCVSFCRNLLFNYHPNISSRSTTHAAPQDRELNKKSALLVLPAFLSVEISEWYRTYLDVYVIKLSKKKIMQIWK